MKAGVQPAERAGGGEVVGVDHLDERDGAEELLKLRKLLLAQRVALLADKDAFAHRDRGVGDGADAVCVFRQNLPVAFQRPACRHRDDHLACQQLRHRRHHLLDEVGFDRQDDPVAALDYLLGGCHRVDAQISGGVLQLVEMRRAGVHLAARQHAGPDQSLGDGLRHVAESDESEFDFHNASPRFPDGQPQVASCLLHQYTRQI